MKHRATHVRKFRVPSIGCLIKSVAPAVLWVMVWPMTPAAALTINVVPDFANSGLPSHDPMLLNLVTITNAAAARWEQIIQEFWTLQVTVSYFPTGHVGGAETNLQGIITGKPFLATIEVAAFDGAGGEHNLYFDPTPNDDSEYALETELYAGLDSDTQTNYFNGDVPDGLELARAGEAKPGQTAAEEGWDMLGVMMHELGHALGMSNQESGVPTPALVEIQNDFDYDVNPALVGGQTMAVRTFGEDNDPGDPRDWAHIASESLMHAAGFGNGRRELITATDVFAVASASSFDPLQIDLPGARYFISGDLADGTRWVGGRTPNAGRDAYVISGVGTATTGSIQTKDFFVGLDENSDGATVLTLANTIEVWGDATIEGNSLIANDVSTLSISSGGFVKARNNLMVRAGGILRLSGGDMEVYRELHIDESGIFEGKGMALLIFGPNLLVNNGLIQGTGGADELFISSVGSNTLDLDGTSENGQIEAVLGDVRIGSGTLADAFDGSLTVGAGCEFYFTQDWVVGIGGTVNLDGTMDSAASVGGGLVTVEGTVTADKAGEFRSETSFSSTATVQAPDSDDTLRLTGNSEFDGAAFTGSGTLVQNVDISVIQDTQIDTATFDWGNSFDDQFNQLTVHVDSELIVNSPTTGETDNPYRGLILLDGGILTVNTNSPWLLPQSTGTGPEDFGKLVMQAGEGMGTARLKGQPVTVEGLVHAEGGVSYIHADITVRSPGQVVLVGTSSELVLEDNVSTFAGGKLTGPGTLTQHGDIHVTSDTSVDAGTFDWGNSIMGATENRDTKIVVNEGVDFTVNASTTGTADNEYRGAIDLDGGNLVINTAALWTLPATGTAPGGGVLPAGILNLNQPASGVPSVEGKNVRVLGQINIDAARAEIDSATLDAGSQTQFLQDSELRFRQELFLAAGTINHNNSNAEIVTKNSSTLIEWVGDTDLTVQGSINGALTFSLGPNATVAVSPTHTPTLTIDPDATVIVGGVIDPFTDSANPNAQVTVINNSTNTLNITNGQAVGLADLSGAGHTVIGSGSSLTADVVSQIQVHIESNALLSVRKVDSSITTTTGLFNDGRLSVIADKLTIFGPVTNNGEVHLPFNHTVTFNDLVSGLGNYIGPGTTNFNGGMAPGANPTEVSFEGNVTLGDGNTLEIEIGGTILGDEYDSLAIAGAASLAGTFDISLIDGFTPTAGDTFEIINAANVLDVFDTLNLPALPGDLLWFVNYGATSVELVSTFGADFDEDGDVDDVDLAAWEGGFGSAPAVHMDGDANADALANGFDFLAWQRQVGDGGATVAATATIPEPATVVLLVGLATVGLLTRRGRCVI